MVSNMETNSAPEEDLSLTECAAVAPWIDTPSPSPWWSLAGGLWAGALVFILGERESWHPAVWISAVLVVVVLVGAWVGFGQARLGALPRLRNAPPEFVPLIRAYFVVYLLLVALVAALFVVIDSRVAAVVAAVGFYALLVIVTRRSSAAAEAVRSRLG